MVARRLGAKVRWLRERDGLTQIELAQQVGLKGKASISLIESGTRWPTLETLVRLADLFGVTTDYLLRDEMGAIGETSH